MADALARSSAARLEETRIRRKQIGLRKSWFAKFRKA
jgi:hypothetical protein